MQIEIITRPNVREWSGNANFGLRSDVLNARNAFARAETPEQFRRFNMGLRGPIVAGKTSLRFNVDGNRSFDSPTIIALNPDGTEYRDTVRRPNESTNFTAGLEHALTNNQTLRLEYRGAEHDTPATRASATSTCRSAPPSARATSIRCASRCRA